MVSSVKGDRQALLLCTVQVPNDSYVYVITDLAGQAVTLLADR